MIERVERCGREMIRELEAADAEVIARLARDARRSAIANLPDLHTPVEDIAFYRQQISSAIGFCFEEAGAVVGFVLGQGQLIEHLYVAPGFQRQGIGTLLLECIAQAMPGRSLRLWTFQSNDGATSFYRHHGFKVIDQTDGSGNEEGLPDYLLERIKIPSDEVTQGVVTPWPA